MINNFYSSVNNGNLVDKCSHKQHHIPEQPYLLRNNFLNEFRTALEKAKVRANLGIADSETLFWGNIQGDIAEQADISKYINSLLAFDYSINNNFDAGDNFQNIKNVRDAAITCLDYLSKFKGEGAEIQELDTKIKEILKNLYAVESLDDVEASQGGVINELTTGIRELQDKLGNPNTTVEDIETKLDVVEENVNRVNTVLEDINSLLVEYVPTDGTNNALEIIPDTETTESRPKVDEQGNPVYDELGFQVVEEVTVIKKGGLYVKDLQPQIDELNSEINGDSGKISLLQKDIQKNSEGVQGNKTTIENIQSTTIPAINEEISNIKRDYISKESLGSSSSIVTDDKLQQKLGEYVKTDSTASLNGITSKNDTINIDKPLNFTTNAPGDSRRYVQKKEDLLKITNSWPGMEVIVIEDALMYILKKDGDPQDPTYDGWKIADSLKIEVLSREEFEERKKAGDLNPLVYYYIYTEDITFKEYPVREEYETQEEFNQAVQNWRKAAFILQGQYMSAAWGQDIDTRLKYKVDKTVFNNAIDNAVDRISVIETFFNSEEGDTLSSLKESIQTIYRPAYIETNSKGEEVSKPASGILVTLSDKVNDIDERVKILESQDFVTWDSLGGESGGSLEDGETLFVKTSTYKKDRESDAKEFTTEKLTFPGTTIIHHDAVEEISHIDELTGEKVIDSEAQEAYDEEVPDPLSIIRDKNRIKVGQEEVAFKDELLKTVEFDSYPIYFEWIQGRGTIDGKPESQTYDEWIVGKNLDDWYFVIKYDGTVLPPKNDGESQEAYETRLEPFKKGMLLTAYDAESLYATRGALQAAVDSLTAKVNYENMRVTKVKEQVTQGIEQQNNNINQIETNLNQTCAAQREENIRLNQNTLNTFYTAWGKFYNPESGITNLDSVMNISEQTITTSVTEVLKEFTISEVAKVSSNKLEVSSLNAIWDTYYTTNESGVITYTPLKDILSAIIGSVDDENSLSLASLKAQIDLRETIENHQSDIESLKTELKEYSDTNRDSAIDKCLNSVSITYKELKELRDTKKLVKGKSYKIIDYITTSKDATTKVIWHPFDIVVTAINTNELSEIAYAAHHDLEDDYYQNCNLTAWELRYILDNDETRYSWIDDRYTVKQSFKSYSIGDIITKSSWEELSETEQNKCEQIGKGIIYYMKDEFNNECAYDFKSILFERYYIPQLVSDKALAGWIINKNYSAISATIQNTGVIFPFYKSSNEGEDPSKFYYTYDTGEQVELTVYNANNGLNTCRDNHFAYPCNFYNVMYDGVDLLLDKNKIVLNNNVFIGTEFVSNTCNQQGFAFNTILNGASFNTFGANFAFNIIEATFTNNIFQNDCRRNVINARFKYNTAGNKFSDNCISTDSENNIFRELFVNNALSAHTTENIFGNNIKASEFPEYFKNNELGGDTLQLKVSDTAKYMQFCYFNKGIYQLEIVDSQKRSNQNSWYQYIHFNWCSYSNTRQINLSNSNFQGTGNNFKISPGNKYIVEVQNSTTPDLGYVWCPASVINFVNEINNKITTLQSNLSTLDTKLTKVESDLKTLENKFTAEQAYTDKIATALTQFAKNNGVTITLQRS